MIVERYYRCYLMHDGHISRPADVFSFDDADAIDQAAEILSTAIHTSIEVWRGKEHVATVNRSDMVAAADRDVSVRPLARESSRRTMHE